MFNAEGDVIGKSFKHDVHPIATHYNIQVGAPLRPAHALLEDMGPHRLAHPFYPPLAPAPAPSPSSTS